MLAAYYSRGCDSEELFSSFEIAGSKDFKKYLNRYDTIFLNMQEFLSQCKDMGGMLDLMRRSVLWEMMETYPDIRYFDVNRLAEKDLRIWCSCPESVFRRSLSWWWN